jgi:hypothetical protein
VPHCRIWRARRSPVSCSGPGPNCSLMFCHADECPRKRVRHVCRTGGPRGIPRIDGERAKARAKGEHICPLTSRL